MKGLFSVKAVFTRAVLFLSSYKTELKWKMESIDPEEMRRSETVEPVDTVPVLTLISLFINPL